MRKIFWLVLISLLSLCLFGCGQKTQSIAETNGNGDTIVYRNSQYGFKFYLPESWKGYQIVTGEWEGLAQDEFQHEKIVETGPIIYIRHPGWTSQNPRQDIPIMVFTHDQWDALQRDEFHIGAAPIGPSELGRNSKYVFALPARYNFAYLPGYEEVEDILNNHPLEPTEDTKKP